MRISNPVEIEHFNFIVQLIGRLVLYNIRVICPGCKFVIFFPFRMASIFYGDVFKQEMSLGKSLFQQLVGVYNFSQRFYFVKDPTIIPKTYTYYKSNMRFLSASVLWLTLQKL